MSTPWTSPGSSTKQWRPTFERSAAGTVKRVRGAAPHADWQATPSLSRMRAFVEVKTVWHPMGV